jgi:histidine triad (HIT) family protein
MVGRLLFHLARLPAVHATVRLAFAHASWLLPVRRVVETSTVVAFHHPRPSSPLHVLIVPKLAIPSLLAVADPDVFADVVACACSALEPLGLADAECLLVVNGGRYQDVGQLHFHLVAGPAEPRYASPDDTEAVMLAHERSCRVFVHPRPQRATHLVVRAAAALVTDGAPHPEAVRAAYAVARDLAREQALAPHGFSVILSGPGLRSDRLHVVSGDRA